MVADRGVQLRHRAGSLRLEMKPQFADRIGRLLPERKEKPMSAQALETLGVVALKQPVSLGDISAIRGFEGTGTLQTLRQRKLIARGARLGLRREKLWQATQLFLDTFGLASLEEIYQAAVWRKSSRPSIAAAARRWRKGRREGN